MTPEAMSTGGGGIARGAEALAAVGFYIHPLRERQKKPKLPGWQREASCDAATVQRWWRRWPMANAGVATGPSGLLVVDLDGDEGEATWRALVEKHGDLPPTAEVLTGRGRHLWLRAPEGRRLRNTAGKLGPHVDTRADGGYVVAPPSVHPTGGAYRWAGAAPRSLDELPEAPVWLVDLLDPREDTSVPPLPSPTRLRCDADGAQDARAELSALAETVASAGEGTRNNTLNVAALKLGRLVEAGHLHEHEVRSDLAAAAACAGLPEREVERTITSGLRSGRDKQRADGRAGKAQARAQQRDKGEQHDAELRALRGDRAGLLGYVGAQLQLVGVELTGVRKLLAEPDPEYLLDSTAGTVNLGRSRRWLTRQSEARAAVGDGIGEVFPPLSRDTWHRVTTALVWAAEPVDVGDEATDAGFARSLLAHYLRCLGGRIGSDLEEALEYGSAVVRHHGELHVFSEPLRRWARLTRGEALSPARLGKLLRAVGAEPRRLDVRGAKGERLQASAWRLPPEVAEAFA